MFIVDMPQNQPSISHVEKISASVAAKSAVKNADWVIGVCHLSENPYEKQSAVNVMSVQLDATRYIFDHTHRVVKGPSRITVIRPPVHGTLEHLADGQLAYYPAERFLGKDATTLDLSIGKTKIRIAYVFIVMKVRASSDDGPDEFQQYCPAKKRVWRINVPPHGAEP